MDYSEKKVKRGDATRRRAVILCTKPIKSNSVKGLDGYLDGYIDNF